MSDKPEDMSVPDDAPITIEYREFGDVQPSAEEQAAVRKLAEILHDVGKRRGVKYKTLNVFPRENSEDFRFFQTGGSNSGNLDFDVNIQALLECMHDGINLEGPILHEMAHIKYPFKAPLLHAATAVLRVALNYYEPVPDEVIRQFGSVKNLENTLRDFEEKIRPLTKALNNPALRDITPEALVNMRTSGHLAYHKFEQALECLPSFEEMARLHAGLITSFPMQPFDKQQQLFQKHHGEFPTVVLQCMNLFMMYKHIFLTSREANEYFMDEDALKYSTDPDSLSHALEWFAEHKAKWKKMCSEETRYQEFGDHPSIAKRIARLKFIQTNGRAPDREELSRAVKEEMSKRTESWLGRVSEEKSSSSDRAKS